MEINKAFDLYLKFLIIEKNLSDSSIESYKFDFNEYLDVFNYIKDTSDIKKGLIDDFIFIESNRGYSSKTIKRRTSTINNFYIFLESEKICENIVENFQSQKIEKKLPEFLTIKETNDLLNYFKNMSEESSPKYRNYCIILIMYSCALRVSEVINLKLKDINITEKLVKIKGKGNKEREVPINDKCIESIIYYMRKIRPNFNIVDEKYLFLNNNGSKLTRQYIYEIIKESLKDININKNISPHSLRHSLATHLLQNGANLKTIQEFLGHSKIETTEIYTHLDEKNKVKSYDLFWNKK